MMEIGVIVLDDNNKGLEMANSILPFLKTIGKYGFGSSYEIVTVAESPVLEKKRRKLKEKDGYLFVTPTFSNERPDRYSEFFHSIHELLENKSAMVVCFGKDKEKENTVMQIKQMLLNYQVALPAKELYLPKYSIVEWEIETKVEKTVNEQMEQFLLWTMAMRFARNIKGRLVT